MIEASWCEQHDLFYWESLNSQPVALSETDPTSLPTDSRLIYIAWEQIFLTTWVIDLYKAQMFSVSAEALSEWHKLLLIKILTIHCKWVFSVNMVWAGANGACWGLLGNRGTSESTSEESMLGQKERTRSAVFWEITWTHGQLTTDKTQTLYLSNPGFVL